MGICWYCYWGWPKAIADIYIKALIQLDGDEEPLLYGPGHIVWADENWDAAAWCLEHFTDRASTYSDEALAVVRWSLQALDTIPLQNREIVPEGYDDAHPEQYPPAQGVEVVKVS